VVEAIALDSEKILPVSSVQHGTLGISDIALSLPTVVGKRGVHKVVKPSVSEAETEALLKSAEALKATLALVKGA
ncbi:L-lactate dehydrogenase, partial [bacterium]